MRAPDLLICGEAGAGKGSLAESLGRDVPLCVLDCRAPPSALVEAVLFGYARSNCFGPGGPIVNRGVLEHAGTLVLDELAALPAELHPRLARALATRQTRRIGESVTRPLGPRVIATSADPAALAPVLREQFVEHYVAPLRERLGAVAPSLPQSLTSRLARLRLDLATVRRIAASDDPAAEILELELLAAIAESTDDGPRLVYADVLLARGNVLGELVHVQCQLERKRTRRLEAHERRLLAAYGSAWLAPVLAVPHVTSAVLRRGFVEVVRGTADVVRATDVLRRVAPALRELWADGELAPL